MQYQGCTYDEQAPARAKALQPSPRGELEITDLNRVYLDANELSVEVMGRGTAWLDTGSHDSLASATDFVKVIERRQGLKIACLEEIGFYMDWLTLDEHTDPIKLSFMKASRESSSRISIALGTFVILPTKRCGSMNQH